MGWHGKKRDGVTRRNVRKFAATIAVAIRPIDKLLSRLLPIPTPVRRPAIIGHRGTPIEHPENTLISFDEAISLGVDGIELDVVFTSDGVPVVCHDHDISDRVPPRQRPAIVNREPWETARCLRVGFPGASEPLSTLDESLRFLRGKVSRVFVHYKEINDPDGTENSNHVEQIATCVRDSETTMLVVVMVESGNLTPWLESASDLSLLRCWTGPSHQPFRFAASEDDNRDIPHLGLLHRRGQLSPAAKYLHHLGFERTATYFGFGPTRRLIRDAQQTGKSFVVFTINDPFLMRLYAHAGIDAIGSDDPGLLTSVLSGDA